MQKNKKNFIFIMLIAVLTFSCSEQNKTKVDKDAPQELNKELINKQAKASQLTTEYSPLDDIQLGKNKSIVCASCHGSKGISYGPLWPNLAGLSSDYIEKQLKNFRSKVRINPMMQLYTESLTDEDIKHLAAYYASLK